MWKIFKKLRPSQQVNLTEAEQKQKRRKRCGGFTLLEVVAVTAMLGILAAMLMPSISGANDRARNAKLKNDLAVVDQALQIYKLDKDGTLPAALTALVTEGYISKNKGLKDAKNEEFAYDASSADGTYTLSGQDSTGAVIPSEGSGDIPKTDG